MDKAVSTELKEAQAENDSQILEIQRIAKQKKELAVADAQYSKLEEALSETESRIKKAIADPSFTFWCFYNIICQDLGSGFNVLHRAFF